MDNSEEQQSVNGRRTDDGDRADRFSNGEGSVDVSSSGDETAVSANRSVTRRLTEILVEERDGDLLLQRSDREDGVIQWIRALDLQVMGACRADERLKPLLKMNVSAGVAEDGLLAHLSQHFEPSEVGLLARCLCIPLVSIRVGKIMKQGSLLSPSTVRGNLCLTLMPTSDLRISFNGDDGSVERLATLSSEAQCTDIEIEEISTDKSGRSFLIKNSDSMVSYFWCSEKSKLLGDELCRKMKDLLVRKPSLAELTGISESRLNCFATQLRAYLAGSVAPSDDSADSADSSELRFPQSSFNCSKGPRFRQYSSQGSKTNLIYQSSLSPRSSSFKEGLQKSLSNIRCAAREKLRRRGENLVPCIDSLSFASSNSSDASGSNCFQKDKHPEANVAHSFASLSFLDVFGTSTELPHSGLEIQIPFSDSSPFSPHYCWCPPVASALQYTKGNPQLLPISSTESSSLPPLSSLLSSARTSDPFQNLSEVPPLDFPSLLPEPLVRLPTSQQIPTFTPLDFPSFLPEHLVRLSSSQQIPTFTPLGFPSFLPDPLVRLPSSQTFTPLICDPIVHIPVIDVCSSGQGYLVSAGPAMSTSIPPLKPNLMNPLLPNAESMVEKSARETLRMLINSSNQPKPQLLEVFPSVFSSRVENQNILAAGSRGLYSGTVDVNAIPSSMSAVSAGGGIVKSCATKNDLIDQKEKPSSSRFDEGID